jgi:hypothetical protein
MKNKYESITIPGTKKRINLNLINIIFGTHENAKVRLDLKISIDNTNISNMKNTLSDQIVLNPLVRYNENGNIELDRLNYYLLKSSKKKSSYKSCHDCHFLIERMMANEIAKAYTKKIIKYPFLFFTNSTTFYNRLQVYLAKKVIPIDLISVFFFGVDKDNSLKITKIKLEESYGCMITDIEGLWDTKVVIEELSKSLKISLKQRKINEI